MPRPLDIVHVRGRNVLEVSWDDDVRSCFPVPYLRAWCPCAACQGHGNTVRYQDSVGAVEIASVHEIGAYAIGIRFGDGHDTGLYTWTWLRNIAPESPPVGLKRGVFDGAGFTSGGEGGSLQS